MEINDSILSQVVINNINRERWTLSKWACKNNKGIRGNPQLEKIPDRKNIRPVFFHDTDRIIHSMAYTRYIDKTQVFYLFEHDHITHRVLHVQFVSKIGRVIGRCLRLNEDLIEAISLGHDLGHVPYGHDGEKILNNICKDEGIGCFCHNAQSVRCLTSIEQNGNGLNLSLQVLDGILAHNGEMITREYKPDYKKTWGHFEEEYGSCFRVEGYEKRIIPMTLEGCVVRVSDVIAYVGRDIEDAITIGLIKREDIPTEISAVLGSSNDTIINALAIDLIKNSYEKDSLTFSDSMFEALDKLKAFNYSEIYFNPKIKTETEKIENMYHQLFEKYHKDLTKERRESNIYKLFLINMSESYKTTTEQKRIVIDFISGMTDDFFNNQFSELFVPKRFGYALPS